MKVVNKKEALKITLAKFLRSKKGANDFVELLLVAAKNAGGMEWKEIEEIVKEVQGITVEAKIFKHEVCECDITGRVAQGMMVADSRESVKKILDERYGETLRENDIEIEVFDSLDGYQIVLVKP